MSRSPVSDLEDLDLVSTASRCVVRVSPVWKIDGETREPTSAHQDPDVEDRSQQFPPHARRMACKSGHERI